MRVKIDCDEDGFRSVESTSPDWVYIYDTDKQEVTELGYDGEYGNEDDFQISLLLSESSTPGMKVLSRENVMAARSDLGKFGYLIDWDEFWKNVHNFNSKENVATN